MIGRTMALALSLRLAADAARAADRRGRRPIYFETCGKGDQAIVLIHDGVINSASFDDMWPVSVTTSACSATTGAATAGRRRPRRPIRRRRTWPP